MTTIRSLMWLLALPPSEARFLERASFSRIWLRWRCTRPLDFRAAERATLLPGVARRPGVADFFAGTGMVLVLATDSRALTSWSFRMLCQPRTPPRLAICARSFCE